MVPHYNFGKKLCFFFLLIFSYHFAQVGTEAAEIDRLQKKEFARLQEAGDFKGIVSQEQRLIKRSGELHYTKGVITGYLNIASSLFILNRNKESMQFLEIADRELENYHDPVLNARLNIVYAKNYFAFDLYNQSNEALNKAERISLTIPDKQEKKKRLYLIYTWKRKNFSKMNMLDSIFKMEHKSLMLAPDPELYAEIAERNLTNKRTDSAEYYLGKALALCYKCPVRQKAIVLENFGKLYIEKKEYEKALGYFSESLEISKKGGFTNLTRDIYKLFFETYGIMNNVEKENEYLEKYTLLNDSLNAADRSVLMIPIEKLLKENAEAEKNSKKKLYYLIIGIILICLAIILIIFRTYRKKQKRKDTLLVQKEAETDILKKKLDGVLENVIQLAINKDPLFIIKFKETYSEFYHNLARQYPDLTSGDLKFCAFVKLNFSNKEIAEYGNMSIRTVESKKYRLRKKMNLPSDIDLNKWIASLA